MFINSVIFQMNTFFQNEDANFVSLNQTKDQNMMKNVANSYFMTSDKPERSWN